MITIMKFDMHCHTKEGSMDGKVSIEEYIRILKSKGFGGMLISDHNSYNGYREWRDEVKGKKYKDFVVLKGVEYDTLDGGHILVIMPQGVKLKILELRGLPVWLLIHIVHHYGGILGPAHPYGERFMSFVTTKRKSLFGKYQMDELMRKFDFVEAFNACESVESNGYATKLAKRYRKPGFGGSDAHKIECIGMAYTELPEDIRQETDLIQYIRNRKAVSCGGYYYTGTTKSKLGKWNKLLVYSFYPYNKIAGIMRSIKRRKELKKL